MVSIELLAEAALRRDGLQLRSLAQEFVRQTPRFASVPRPKTEDLRVLATAASLLELFAQRAEQAPPLWTGEVGAVPEPFFLLEAAARMKRLRALCELESPEPLKRRQLYAPPDFLSSV